MCEIQSFNLKGGDRIGNYRVIENIGRGWEGEVYKVAELPTEAVRALKLFRTDELDSVRHLVHFAWFYEQVRCTGHFPVYYHYGQWFFNDDNGSWFLIFEFIEGRPLNKLLAKYSVENKEKIFYKLVTAVADVHEYEYAIGDFYTLDNVFFTEEENIIFIDCHLGEPDNPNYDYENDCKEELVPAARRIFGKSMPNNVKKLMVSIINTPYFTKSTLRSLMIESQ